MPAGSWRPAWLPWPRSIPSCSRCRAAAEISRALSAPLDLILVRKLSVPGQPELAAGALVDGEAPEAVFNADVVQACGLSPAQLARMVAEARAELELRRRLRWAARRPSSTTTVWPQAPA